VDNKVDVIMSTRAGIMDYTKHKNREQSAVSGSGQAGWLNGVKRSHGLHAAVDGRIREDDQCAS
jgi:hypothetical protein